MLEIITDGEKTDLLPDTQIELTFEQPMLADDRIPAPYSFDYELPLTPRNRRLFGYPDRTASDRAFEKIPSEIVFSGIVVARGTQKIDEVTDRLTVSFTGAVFPNRMRKYLSSLPLGSLGLGSPMPPLSGSDRVRTAQCYTKYNEILSANIESFQLPDQPYACMVAPLEGIKGVEMPESGGAGSYVRQDTVLINAYKNGYLFADPGAEKTHMSKILPAFRVGWLFDELFGVDLRNNIFNGDFWKRLMLVSRWHPKYLVEDDAPPIDIGLSSGVKYADFLPKIAANDFVAQMLKLACATMFIRGNSYEIEYNGDVLTRSVDVEDWTGRMIGEPTISHEDGMIYDYGYSGEEGRYSDEIVPKEVDSISDMFADANAGDDVTLRTYRIATTGQLIESLFDDDTSNRVRFNVVNTLFGKREEPETDGDEQDERSTFDMKFNGSPLANNLRCDIGDDSTTLGHFSYIPEGDPIGEERPEDLTVGIYWGLKRSLAINPSGSVWTPGAYYPYLSYCNYDAQGNRLGDTTLRFDGADGLLQTRHRAFKEWIERDKRLLTVQVRLSALDLHRLDLRNKVSIRNRMYLIKTLSVVLTPMRIETAEAELVEV